MSNEVKDIYNSGFNKLMGKEPGVGDVIFSDLLADNTVNDLLNAYEIEETIPATVSLTADAYYPSYTSGTVRVNYKRPNRPNPPQVLVVVTNARGAADDNTTRELCPTLVTDPDVASPVGYNELEYVIYQAARQYVDIIAYTSYTYTNGMNFMVYVLRDKVTKQEGAMNG